MNSTAKILIKFATRSRPDKFLSCLDNIRKNLSNHNDWSKYIILVSCDNDDETMPSGDKEFWDKAFTGLNMVVYHGDSKNKIHAINRDIEKVKEWDILINTSDDMMFICPMFDDVIRSDFAKHFPDLDGVLHYNDGLQKDNCMTMSIIGRKYYDRDKYIYHPDYKSVCCDVEATEVAKMRGKYIYMGDHNILFNHLHPAYGLAEWDGQYIITESKELKEEDMAVYIRRKEANFETA